MNEIFKREGSIEIGVTIVTTRLSSDSEVSASQNGDGMAVRPINKPP